MENTVIEGRMNLCVNIESCMHGEYEYINFIHGELNWIDNIKSHITIFLLLNAPSNGETTHYLYWPHDDYEFLHKKG